MALRLFKPTSKPDWRLLISSLLVLAAVLILLLAKWQIDRRNSGSEHILLQQNIDKWASQGASSYTIVLNSAWQLGPLINVKMVVRDGKVISQEPVYCERQGTEEAQAQCKLRGNPTEYTIEALFAAARECTTSTKAYLVKCDPAIYDGFMGFSDSRSMIEIGDNCAKSVAGDPLNFLCFVEYEPTYGYPKGITWYLPQAFDAFGGIYIESIQVNK